MKRCERIKSRIERGLVVETRQCRTPASWTHKETGESRCEDCMPLYPFPRSPYTEGWE